MRVGRATLYLTLAMIGLVAINVLLRYTLQLRLGVGAGARVAPAGRRSSCSA